MVRVWQPLGRGGRLWLFANRKLRAARVGTLAEFLRLNDGAEHSTSSEDVFARARFDLKYQKAALVLHQS